MAKIWGQLERAQLENVSSDPAGGALTPEGRIWWQTTSNKILASDGAALKTVAFSDDIISRSNVQSMTASRAVVSDGSGLLSAASVTSTELGYVSGVTSAIQSQINALGGLNSNGVWNIGLSLSSGTLSIVSANGSSFSGSNPGYVFLPTVSGAGAIQRLSITSNVTVDDAANGVDSDFTGEEFGVTSGVAWGNDRPFYLYAINTDDTDGGLYFGISPNPRLLTTPASGNNIGYKDTPAATPSDNNLFFFTATDVTSKTSKPCVRIGGIRMRMNASDDWTIQTLSSASGDGIRSNPFVGNIFTMPTGQNGATSGRFFKSANSPTWATSANIIYSYTLSLDGFSDIFFSTENAGNCTNGSAGTLALLATPYSVSSAFDDPIASGNGSYAVGTGRGRTAGTQKVIASGLASSGLFLSTVSSSYTAVFYNSLSDTSDDIEVRFKFKPF